MFSIVNVFPAAAGVAASFYAVFAVMTILGLAVGGFLSGPLITGLGYLGTGVFVTIGVIPNFPLIYLIFKGTNYAKMVRLLSVVSCQIHNKLHTKNHKNNFMGSHEYECQKSDVDFVSISVQLGRVTCRNLALCTEGLGVTWTLIHPIPHTPSLTAGGEGVFQLLF